MLASVVAALPGTPRLLQWMWTGCGRPSALAASVRVSRIARGVTLRPETASSRPVTLRCPVFHASTPPGFTIFTAYPPVAPSSQAA
jgi:hypothetical protein